MKKNFLLLYCLIATCMIHAQHVGIGTTNPLFKLDVRDGSINTDSVYRVGTITVLASPGVGNLFVGEDAGRINTGFYNTFNGDMVGLSNTTGSSNSFFGQTAGFANTTGEHNAIFGRSAGSANTAGNYNSFYGRSAAYANTTGSYNTAIGYSTLNANSTGTLNTALGYNANINNTGVLTNATAIGANARVDCSNCLVLGSVNTVNGAISGVAVGIGTTNPQAILDVNGNTKTNSLTITDGGNQSDFLIKSNPDGQVSFRKGYKGLGVNYIIAFEGEFPSEGGPQAQGPMIGEIRTFSGNFAPSGWALCQGQLLAIPDYELLFYVIGTTYGGDGVNNFALPDLRSAVPVGEGSGWYLGEQSN